MKTISFRVSDDVATQLDEQVAAACITRTDYLIGRITEQKGSFPNRSAEVAGLTSQIEALRAEILVLQERQTAETVIQEEPSGEPVIQSSFNDPARAERKAARVERKADLQESVTQALPARQIVEAERPTYLEVQPHTFHSGRNPIKGCADCRTEAEWFKKQK